MRQFIKILNLLSFYFNDLAKNLISLNILKELIVEKPYVIAISI